MNAGANYSPFALQPPVIPQRDLDRNEVLPASYWRETTTTTAPSQGAMYVIKLSSLGVRPFSYLADAAAFAVSDCWINKGSLIAVRGLPLGRMMTDRTRSKKASLENGLRKWKEEMNLLPTDRAGRKTII